MTEAAGATVRNLLIQKNVPDYGLRVFVAGGGCSGMQYGMALEAEARDYAHVIEPVSYTHLDVYKRQRPGRAFLAPPSGHGTP